MSGLRTGERRHVRLRKGIQASGPGQSTAEGGRRRQPLEASESRRDWRRLLPVTVAAALSAAYVIASPPSLDLAAHLFRAQLFGREPFGIWNNYWYSGHHIVGYSLLFPAASWALTPQLAAALAATATAALFEPLARRHFGEDAWLGATIFGAATAVNLFTGRLAFAFGALLAMAAIVAIDRRRTGSPVGWPSSQRFAVPWRRCSRRSRERPMQWGGRGSRGG